MSKKINLARLSNKVSKEVKAGNKFIKSSTNIRTPVVEYWLDLSDGDFWSNCLVGESFTQYYGSEVQIPNTGCESDILDKVVEELKNAGWEVI